MNQSRIALGMIVRDNSEVGSLKRCLDSVAPYVDGVYLTATQKPHAELEKLARQYGANIDLRPGEFNYVVPKEEVEWITKFLGYEPHLKEGDVIFQFDKARNANIESIPDNYDWLFWMDADDVLMNGPGLRNAAEMAFSQGYEAVFMN